MISNQKRGWLLADGGRRGAAGCPPRAEAGLARVALAVVSAAVNAALASSTGLIAGPVVVIVVVVDV